MIKYTHFFILILGQLYGGAILKRIIYLSKYDVLNLLWLSGTVLLVFVIIPKELFSDMPKKYSLYGRISVVAAICLLLMLLGFFLSVKLL